MAMASGAGAAEVDLDAPVRGAGHQLGVGAPREEVERLGQVGGTDELPLGDREPGVRGSRSLLGAAGGERVVVVGLPQRVGGVADGAVAVHRQRLPLSACRSNPFGPCSWSGLSWSGLSWSGSSWSRPWGADLAVELGCHAAHETGGAVAALRPAACGHLLLHRVQGAGAPRPSAVTTSWPSSASAGTRQALSAVHSVPAVSCCPSAAGAPRAPSRRRTPPRRSPPWRGQTAGAQEVERVLVRRNAPPGDVASVHHHVQRVHGPAPPHHRGRLIMRPLERRHHVLRQEGAWVEAHHEAAGYPCEQQRRCRSNLGPAPSVEKGLIGESVDVQRPRGAAARAWRGG